MANTTTRGRGTMAAGGLVILASVVVVVVLLLVARARVDDAIGDLARAPSGCDTTLDVNAAGTYLLFVETTGTIDDLAGGCDAPGEYSLDGQLPRVRLDLTGPDGDEVDLDRVGDVTYDAAGFAGTAIRRTDLDETGTYVLRVESTDAVVVSIGKDPSDAAGALPALAVLVGVLGLVGGAALLVAGAMSRRRPADLPEVPPARWWEPPAGAPPGPPQVPVPGPPIAAPDRTSPWHRPPTPGADVPVHPVVGPPNAAFPPPPPPPGPPGAAPPTGG